MRDVLKVMTDGRWDLEKLITHEFPIDRISEAIEMAADTDKALNVMLRF